MIIPYDIESYPNIFTFTAYSPEHQCMMQWEISWRKNMVNSLLEWLYYWKAQGVMFSGFNNIGYDHPVVHQIMTDPLCRTAGEIYKVNERIIGTPWEKRWSNRVPQWETLLPQVDLMLIHHFDNDAKRTSLKQLEFVMRMHSIEDLPYPPGYPIPETNEAAELLLGYNKHDVKATLDFTNYSSKAIEFRNQMSAKYGIDFTNHNDTKIGKDYFIKQLQDSGVVCYNADKSPKQSYRNSINLGEVIFPYVQFKRPEFQQLLATLKNTTITETKGALSHSVTVDGFTFVFGLGGIHGSVESTTLENTRDISIVDADVASYYPNLAIANRVYPEHLGEKFCDVYSDVYNQRKQYAKKTVENAAMKLALNGVYGDSNNKYSVFYDPKYTMTITVNGQLLLCMLAERLMEIPGLEMIQINTDGLTVRFHNMWTQHYEYVCSEWQKLTGLTLEFVKYRKMSIRDVNNYIAIPESGSPKYKGVYVHTSAVDGGELGWHQNHSALIIKKAAAAAIVDGKPVRETILNHRDPFDFYLLAKVGRKDGLHLFNDVKWGDTVVYPQVKIQDCQRISRYYISNTGHKLIKTMPPLKRRGNSVDMYLPGWKSKTLSGGKNKNLKVSSLAEYNQAIIDGYRTKDGGDWNYTPVRKIGIDADYFVTIANTVDGSMPPNINYEYYITEAEKLVNKVKGL